MNEAPTSLITIEEEMSRAYMDYAMSVIISRAIPDVRDGLKPVHRRILYAMKEGGYDAGKPFRKSARIVGDVMGKYHPHGDTAIYDTMVRMAQQFSMRLVLINGQGNFGSMDGDRAAAMRYTEARLNLASEAMLLDIEKDTVDFTANYDETEFEPVVLPTRIPNLLVNGASGIAVGMATNIPPHHLGEVIDATRALLDNPDIDDDELYDYVPAPDFPTGGIIIGKNQIRNAYKTGRGGFIIRARTHFEEIGNNRMAIIVTEIPFQVNKAKMIEKIAELVRDKVIEGISALRDESDRQGVRVAIELKANQQENVILAQLFKFTSMEQRFSINMLALCDNKPEQLTLRRVLESFLTFREQVILRRTRWHLQKARIRAHQLAGLLVALHHIDKVIEMIKQAADPQSARQELTSQQWEVAEIGGFLARIDRIVSSDMRELPDITHYQLSEEQAKAILELRLQRLTGMEREKLLEEAENLATSIEDYVLILQSSDKRKQVIIEELDEIKDQFADPRRSEISDELIDDDTDIEALIQREDMVVTITHKGYIKRVPLEIYRAQKRGGRGRSGMAVRDEDFVNQILQASTHTNLLFFTDNGMVYQQKVWRLPLGEPQHRGKPLINLISLDQNERITAILALPEGDIPDNLSVMFATSKGYVRRNSLSDFDNIRKNGLIAMKLNEQSGMLTDAVICNNEDDILLSSAEGSAIRFKADTIRLFVGRNSIGVRGIRLNESDNLVGMSILQHSKYDSETREQYMRYSNLLRRENLSPEETATLENLKKQEILTEMAAQDEFLLTVTENGFGKRSSAFEYRLTNRGGRGITNIVLSARNGKVVASFPVTLTDHVMMVTDKGQLIRCPVSDIRIIGRRTQGVTLFKTSDDEQVVSVAKIAEGDNEDEDNADDVQTSVDTTDANLEGSTVIDAENNEAATDDDSAT